VEGGSKRAILDDWTLDDVAALREHWMRYGPPVHIGLTHVAASLGVKLTAEPKPKKSEAPPARDLSETLTPDVMSDVALPVAGGDTLAASKAILEKLKAMHGG
jgi:hypothetical protein